MPDRSVQVWRADADEDPIARIAPFEAELVLFDAQDRWLALGGRDGIAELRDTTSWRRRARFKAANGPIAFLLADQNGTRLLAVTSEYEAPMQVARYWSPATNSGRPRYPRPAAAIRPRVRSNGRAGEARADARGVRERRAGALSLEPRGGRRSATTYRHDPAVRGPLGGSVRRRGPQHSDDQRQRIRALGQP